jgi:hypothetical protein
MDRLLVIGNAEMWKTHNKDKPLGQVVSYMSDMGEDAGYKLMSTQKSR